MRFILNRIKAIMNQSNEPVSRDENSIHTEDELAIISQAAQAAAATTEPKADGNELPAAQPQNLADASLGAKFGAAVQAGGLPRLATILVAGAGMYLFLMLIRETSDFVAPMFFAWNLMIVAYPSYRFLTNHKVPRGLAALLAGIVVFGILILIIWGMIWSVIMMVQELPKYSDQFHEVYQTSISWLKSMGISEEMILQRLKNIDPNNVIDMLSKIVSQASGIGSLLVVLVMAMFFIIMDTPGMKGRMDMIASSHPHFSMAMRDFNIGVRRYWVVTSLFGAIVAVLDWAVLVALGVPLASVWMLFSFLTNYIPNIGFVIGLIPPALLALVANGPVSCIVVVVLYWVLNFVAQGIIQPRYTGDAVGVTPTISFLSLMLWGWVLGGMGALLALPCTLLAKALLIDCDPNTRWINVLISSDPEADYQTEISKTENKTENLADITVSEPKIVDND